MFIKIDKKYTTMKRLVNLLVVLIGIILLSTSVLAWDNSSYNNRKAVTFGVTTRTFEPIILNLTQICGASNCSFIDYHDIKITENSSGTEYTIPYEFLNGSYYSTMDNSTNRYIQFIANDTSKTYYVYYNNSAAPQANSTVFKLWDSFEIGYTTNTDIIQFFTSNAGRLLVSSSDVSLIGSKSITRSGQYNPNYYNGTYAIGMNSPYIIEIMLYENSLVTETLDSGMGISINDGSGGSEATDDTGIYMYSNNWYYKCRNNTGDPLPTNIGFSKDTWYSARLELYNDRTEIWANDTLIQNCSSAGSYFNTSEITQVRMSSGNPNGNFAGTSDDKYLDNIRISNYKFKSYSSINTVTLGNVEAFVSNTVPAITLHDPADNYHSTTNLSVNFTVTDTESDPVTCSLYINGTVNAIRINVPLATPTTINATGMNQQAYAWQINCSDGLLTSVFTTNRTYIVDTVLPTINFTYPSSNVSTNKNISLNITGYDINLWGMQIFINYSNGTNFYYENITGITPPRYLINNNIFFTSDNNYSVMACFEDSHTDTVFDKVATISKDINKKELAFVFDDANIKVSLLSTDNKNTVKNISSTKTKDRYSFEFDITDKENKEDLEYTYVFKVDSDLTVYQVLNSEYKGHFILGKKYWIDFEGIEGNVNILSVEDNSFTVEIKTKQSNLIFNSLGGLNIFCGPIYWINYDTTAPIINSLSNISVTDTSSSVNWSVNEGTNYSITIFDINGVGSSCSDSSYLTGTVICNSGILTQSTTYYVNLTVCDIAGNCAYNNSLSFTTLISPAVGGSAGGGIYQTTYIFRNATENETTNATGVAGIPTTKFNHPIIGYIIVCVLFLLLINYLLPAKSKKQEQQYQ